MILTWLNNNNGNVYTKFYKSYILTDYFVGYINSYNHEVVSILILKNSKIFNVSSYNDYLDKLSYSNKKHDTNIFKKLIFLFK